MLTTRLALPLAALVLLAGCNNSGGAGNGSSSQVVDGTISDAMIPVDTLTSEPPTAEPTAAADAVGMAKAGNADKAAASDTTAAVAESAAPVPAPAAADAPPPTPAE